MAAPPPPTRWPWRFGAELGRVCLDEEGRRELYRAHHRLPIDREEFEHWTYEPTGFTFEEGELAGKTPLTVFWGKPYAGTDVEIAVVESADGRVVAVAAAADDAAGRLAAFTFSEVSGARLLELAARPARRVADEGGCCDVSYAFELRPSAAEPRP